MHSMRPRKVSSCYQIITTQKLSGRSAKQDRGPNCTVFLWRLSALASVYCLMHYAHNRDIWVIHNNAPWTLTPLAPFPSALRIIGKNSNKSMLICILQRPTRCSWRAYWIWHCMYWYIIILFLQHYWSVAVCMFLTKKKMSEKSSQIHYRTKLPD